jgi:endonuclease/exonuclease/phosphatase family metal-dependent hydrolase
MADRGALRILSYNIHKGFSLGNREFVLPRIQAALAALQPDLVFLQEVLGQHDRHAQRVPTWPGESQEVFLASNVWPHTVYGKNASYAHGHHGNALLSKYPIVASENVDISTNAFESRGILHAVLEVPGVSGPLHCMCVHLNMLRRGREQQLAALCRRIVQRVPRYEPLIVAGDFNDWHQGASEILLQRSGAEEVFSVLTGTPALSYPSQFPVLRLDRVYQRGLTPLDGEVLARPPWDALSDHAPLYVELGVERGT